MGDGDGDGVGVCANTETERLRINDRIILIRIILVIVRILEERRQMRKFKGHRHECTDGTCLPDLCIRGDFVHFISSTVRRPK